MYKCPQCDSELKRDCSKPSEINESKTTLRIYNCIKCNCEVKIYTNSDKKIPLLEVNRGSR